MKHRNTLQTPSCLEMNLSRVIVRKTTIRHQANTRPHLLSTDKEKCPSSRKSKPSRRTRGNGKMLLLSIVFGVHGAPKYIQIHKISFIVLSRFPSIVWRKRIPNTTAVCLTVLAPVETNVKVPFIFVIKLEPTVLSHFIFLSHLQIAFAFSHHHPPFSSSLLPPFISAPFLASHPFLHFSSLAQVISTRILQYLPHSLTQ